MKLMNEKTRNGFFADVERWAEELHHWSGLDCVPKWVRVFILSPIVDAIDIALLVVTLLFMALFPPLGHAVRIFFDVWITAASVILHGSTGLLHGVEFVLGASLLLDVLPWVTISGIVDLIRERRQKRKEGEVIEVEAEEAGPDEDEDKIQEFRPEIHERRFQMIGVLLGSIGGLLVGLVYYLGLEIVSGWGGVAGLTLVGCVLGVIAAALGRAGIPRNVSVALAVVSLVFLGLVGGRVYHLSYRTTAGDYRQAAWRELKASEDTLVMGAKKVDDFGKSEGVRAAKEVASGLFEKGKEALREKLEETEETGVGIVDGVVGFLKERAEKRKKTAEEERKKAVQETPENARFRKEAKELELGPAQALLYRSNYVLERAKKAREGLISFWSKLSLAPSMLLLFAGLLFLQAEEGDGTDNMPRTRRNFNPDPNLDWT